LEFGAGGSTCVAALLVKESIISVDSSVEWLAEVRRACETGSVLTQPKLVYVDVGPVAEWGYPSDPGTRERWPNYHSDIWERWNSSDADVYMVDGRFRVACFMQVLLHCRRDALIMIHDFDFRPEYHIVREVAQEISAAESLSVFRRRDDRNETHVRKILSLHQYDPA